MDKNSKDIKLIKSLFVVILVLIGVAIAAFVLWLSVNPRTIENNNIQFMGRNAEGKNAYEIAVLHGFKGSPEQWIASLKGENGVTTVITKEEKTTIEVPAPKPEPAKDGASAYDIWLEEGNKGTKEDFLKSLIPTVNIETRLYRFNELTQKMETKLESDFKWVSVQYCGVSQPCN